MILVKKESLLISDAIQEKALTTYVTMEPTSAIANVQSVKNLHCLQNHLNI